MRDLPSLFLPPDDVNELNGYLPSPSDCIEADFALSIVRQVNFGGIRFLKNSLGFLGQGPFDSIHIIDTAGMHVYGKNNTIK